MLPAVARDSSVPAERLLPGSAAVLSAVQRVMGWSAGLWLPRLREPGLRWSDGTARSLCRDADGALPLASTGGFGTIVTESLAVRPEFEPVCRLNDVHWFADALARVAAIFSDAATSAARATVLAGSLHRGTPFFVGRGRKSLAPSGANGGRPQVRTDLPASVFDADASPPDEKVVGQLSRGIFEHLNQIRNLGRPVNWLLGPADRDRLWTVTLHYHRWAYDLARLALRKDELGKQASILFEELVSDWIAHCDLALPGSRPLAWNAYATATRIVWWIRSAHRLGAAWWSRHEGFRTRFLASLWKQAAYLANHVEWDLRANHLIRDALGLAWAGRFFDGPEPKKWLDLATSLAAVQCREQVLTDGGHFERSPMYHLHVMDDLRVISELSEDPTVKLQLDLALKSMAAFVRWTRHPDGGIPLLNDAAGEIDFAPDDLLKSAAKCGLIVDTSAPRGGRHFADTGLAIWHGKPWTVFFDVGPLGPDEQPGHGHADSLTLECSYDSTRLFVDPGTHSYDRDDRRAYNRSTAAHNTVCVDRTDSSEVWHIFRVGRRAKPLRVEVIATSKGLDAVAAHDGYAHLGVIHHRRVQLADGGALIVTDRLEGRGIHHFEGGWLLADGWTAAAGDLGWETQQANQMLQITLRGPNGLRRSIRARPWHSMFGVETQTPRLTWEWEGELPLEVQTIVEPVGAKRV